MGQREIIKSITDILHKYLIDNKLRKTQERFKILEFIYSIDTHFDVDQLYQMLKNNDFSVSKATVYNTLELFLEAGLVRKHFFSNNAAFYEKSYFNKSHDHLIITDKKGQVEKIIEFCDPRIESIKKDLEENFNVKINDHDLYFYVQKKD